MDLTTMKKTSTLILVTLLFGPLLQGQQAQGLLTIQEVVVLTKKNRKNPHYIASYVSRRGVDFDLTAENQQKLRRAGAQDELLGEIWKATPTGRIPPKALLTGAAGESLETTLEEAKLFQALQLESNPKKQIDMVNEFVRSFPKSRLLSYVYANVAKAYEETGDFAKAVEYGEESLVLDPNNIFSLVLTSMLLPQPKMLRGDPAENAKQLSKAETYANRALELISEMQKSTTESDEQFRKRKSGPSADAHSALGMVHMQRGNYPRPKTITRGRFR